MSVEIAKSLSASAVLRIDSMIIAGKTEFNHNPFEPKFKRLKSVHHLLESYIFYRDVEVLCIRIRHRPDVHLVGTVLFYTVGQSHYYTHQSTNGFRPMW